MKTLFPALVARLKLAAIIVPALVLLSFLCEWHCRIPPDAMVWTLDGYVVPGTIKPPSYAWEPMTFEDSKALGMQSVEGATWTVDTTFGSMVFSRLGMMKPRLTWRMNRERVRTLDDFLDDSQWPPAEQ